MFSAPSTTAKPQNQELKLASSLTDLPLSASMWYKQAEKQIAEGLNINHQAPDAMVMPGLQHNAVYIATIPVIVFNQDIVERRETDEFYAFCAQNEWNTTPIEFGKTLARHEITHSYFHQALQDAVSEVLGDNEKQLHAADEAFAFFGDNIVTITSTSPHGIIHLTEDLAKRYETKLDVPLLKDLYATLQQTARTNLEHAVHRYPQIVQKVVQNPRQVYLIRNPLAKNQEIQATVVTTAASHLRPTILDDIPTARQAMQLGLLYSAFDRLSPNENTGQKINLTPYAQQKPAHMHILDML